MSLKEELSEVVLDEEVKAHIEERHIEKWTGKSRFIIPRDEVYDLVMSMVKEAADTDEIYALQVNNTIVLRKVMERDIGINRLDHLLRYIVGLPVYPGNHS